MPRIRSITPEEAAEFRGLFFGEGHIDLARAGKSRTPMPRVRIAVRDDDRAVVEWCKDLFGGCINPDARTRSVCWTAVGRERLLMVLAALTGGSLPSKKRAEVELLREAVLLIGARGAAPAPARHDRMLQIRDELKALRQYKEVGA